MSKLGLGLGVPHYTFYPVTGPSPDAFVSIWNTANTSSGSSASNQVKLPLTSAGTYDFTVDWGDGNTDVITAWNQAEVTHTYAASGTYTITCTPNAPGQMKGFVFANTGDRLKFEDVVQFGGLQLVATQGQTFYGCANFTGASISDILDTAGVTSMARMYQGCTLYNGPVNFDTSSVANMFFMFAYAANFNQPVNFDTSSVTNMVGMFFQATNFNSSLIFSDTSSVTNMNAMFTNAASFNQPVNFDTSSVTNMQQMFQGAASFNKPLNLNTSSVTSMAYMLASAPSFDQDISAWDIDQVASFSFFMNGSTLSTPNYDALLIAWAAQAPLNPAATFISFGGSKYTSTNPAVVAARNVLVAHFTTFSDGGPV